MTLTISGLGKFYDPGAWVFQNIDLGLQAGAIVHVTGRNGAGKSTLLKILATTLLPSTGAITMNDQDLLCATPALRNTIAMSETTSGFLPKLTGLENLKVFSHFRGIPQHRWLPVLERWKNQPSFLASLQRPYAKCSSGMKQSLTNFLAFCQEPDLLLLDEAETSLDKEARAFILQELQSQRHNRITLIATHSDWLTSLPNLQVLDF